MNAPLFWKLLTAACILWYATITVYVAFRGVADIRAMLRRLSEKQKEADQGKASRLRDDSVGNIGVRSQK